MEDVPQGRVELESGGCERPASDGQVNDLGIGDVVGRVFREPRVEQDLRGGRVLLPHQAHVYRLGALHRNERGDLATDRRISDGVTGGPTSLGRSRPRGNEASDTQNQGRPYCELRQALMASFHRRVLPPQTLNKAESVFPPAALGAPDPRMTTPFFKDCWALREKAVLAGLLSYGLPWFSDRRGRERGGGGQSQPSGIPSCARWR